MTIADAALTAVVLAGTLWLLHRSLWRSGGGACHGCSSAGTCRQPPREPAGLVSLGGSSRPAGRRGGRP